LKRIGFVLILAIVMALPFSQAAPVGATGLYLEVTVTIIVAPKGSDVGMLPLELASAENTTYDVAPIAALQPFVIAQQASVPVTFQTISNPNAKLVHAVANPNPTFANRNEVLVAPYGTTTFPCVYQVYTNQTVPYRLTYWAQGTGSGNGRGTFPLWNAPAASEASWMAEGVTTDFAAFGNNGAPGDVMWSGNANAPQQHCIDWKVNVPDSLHPGIYTATVQYNLVF